nr:integrase, catalytic region, zinc finger, CCHC-type, peptidase aspartic, catalytic [Tanacetum cinerariifolium]
YINSVNACRKSKSANTPVNRKVVQIVLWYLDSGCSKHMTRDRSQLINFVKKNLGTVKFGNDHVAKITDYGDYQIGNVTISRVYYVEGLGHNLFSVGQFCDSDLEVAFRQHSCFIRNLEGVDLVTGTRGNNLYTLSLQDMMVSSPICLLSKASKTKSWIWHRRLSHLNFGAINNLARQEIYKGYCTRISSVKDTRYPIGTSLAIAESIVREPRDHSDCRTSTRTNTRGKFYRLENRFQTQSGIDANTMENSIPNIACAEKLMRIPFGNEILTIRGEGSNKRNESRLNIISCSKAQEYMSKGCHVFLANISSTKDEDKSKTYRVYLQPDK